MAVDMEGREPILVEAGGRRVMVEIGREGKAHVAWTSLMLVSLSLSMLYAVARMPGVVDGCAELLWLAACAVARKAGAAAGAARAACSTWVRAGR